MAVLYRKYRPQTFADVVGQAAIVRTLKNQVAAENPAHAYLFTGSRGVGKTSLARILAKAVNCLESEKLKAQNEKITGDACGICDICKQVQAGTFIDLVEIDAASNTGVDNIREMIEHVKFSPTLGRYKVFIIDEVHMLSKGAFNALLKTLEEPPKHAIFILATTETGKVPATIVSRTQRFDFRLYTPAEIVEHLYKVLQAENLQLPEEVVELVAKNSQGGLRDALSLLDKVLTLGNDAAVEEYRLLLGITDVATCENLLELIVAGKTSELPGWLEELGQKGWDFLAIIREFLEYLRKVLVSQITQGQVAQFQEAAQEARVKEFASRLTLNELLYVIRLFLKAYKEQAFTPDPKLPLLLAAVEAGSRKIATSGAQNNLPTKPIAQATPEVVQKNISPSYEAAAPAPAGAVSSVADATLAEVETFWAQAIERIKKSNGPLANLVKNSSIISVEGGRIRLGVKFAFHKQNLETPKNYNLILQSIQQTCGKNLSLAVDILKEEEIKVADPVQALGEALQILGGEVVE